MNHLQAEQSPYLLQHAGNPVDWYPWGEDAFRKAAAEDKPVFLSIGYSTCHWCHVMAHESFEDAEAAELLNREFVSVKVDREERPDIDAVYMAACQALTGSGGWPLTIFMTPEQQPFFAGTYFPKHRRYGQPGLVDLLTRIAALWKNDRAQLLRAGERLTDAIREEQPARQREPDKALLYQAYRLFRGQFDPVWGGFGQAPKFPTPHNLLFLMRYARLEQQPDALAMAETTLRAMARGGLQDQFGGGFSRYSTDEKWLVPHFEKMLYDNALLLTACLYAYQATGEEEYADTARRTAAYILGELTDPAGGFYCGQDADSDGVEGKYYVFTPGEVHRLLGEADGREICLLYGITAEGNFEGKSIPNRIGREEPPLSPGDSRLQRLCQYRRSRTRLHKDDKVLLSWNAWTIIALARAGRILGEKACAEAAIKAARFIEDNMTDGQNRLFLRWRNGQAAHAGQLEDYAVYALALTELYRLTFETAYLEHALLRGEQMTALFEDKERGGYFFTAADAERLISRPKETYDGALPSGNSAAAMVLQRLPHLTGLPRWQEAADRQFRFLAGEIEHHPAGYSFALLSMADVLYPHRELVCAVRQGVPEELVRYLENHPADNLGILVKTSENAAALAACAPFTAAYPIPETGAAWYLCENGTCRAPVAEFQELPLEGVDRKHGPQ